MNSTNERDLWTSNFIDLSPSKNIEITDYTLQMPAWSIESLKSLAIEQRLQRPRSLTWAILLNAVPQPNEDIVASLTTHRNNYNDLWKKLSIDPRTVIGDDPLSQNDESAWNQHFCDNELKALIMQDVVRTFPDEVYFREKNVQDIMVRVLFFWARTHPYVGYRQGMHEILAPIIFEMNADRKYAPLDLCETLKYYLDDNYLEHDSFMLFSTIMKGLDKFYTTGNVVPTSSGRLPTSKVVHNPNEVVKYLEKLRVEYLVAVDIELARHLEKCKISMELFGIRWLRLLFGREFPRPELPHLWGFIFSDGPLLPNLHYLVLALLVSIRILLLDSDPGAVLSALMRPPPVTVGHVCAVALHLRSPREHPLPPPPCLKPAWRPERGGVSSGGGALSWSEGVAEGADVARELAALALVRARLPPAAAALAKALGNPSPQVQNPLYQILQLSSLLQCRNHALIDVETALEAAEGGVNTEKVGRGQLVSVSVNSYERTNIPTKMQWNKVKEVPLTVFHQEECVGGSDLPFQDPLRLRTD